MRLSAISYEEFMGQPRQWKLHRLPLAKINLIVGRNASGKSRAMNVTHALARCISGVQSMPSSGTFHAEFIDGQDTYEYILTANNGLVTEEKYKKNNALLLDRQEGGFGRMLFVSQNEQLNFQAPPQMLASTSRVDEVQAPYLLPLIQWAHSLHFYPCSTDLGKQAVTVIRADGPPPDLKDAAQTLSVFKEGVKQFGKAFKDAILEDMTKIGYNLSDILVSTPVTITLSVPMDTQSLFVQEIGIEGAFDQYSMSVGMYRALAVLIHLNFGLMSQLAQCVIIDDIGEGLDFDRSSALIKVVIQKVNASEMQVIMTTNDRSVMNGVDVSYWNVLHRVGTEVYPLNQMNRPNEFDEFRFSGLSNFDLLARDMLTESDK